jgi:hypothetical protein
VTSFSQFDKDHIEVCDIRKKTTGEGKPYYTLSINRLGFNTNLGPLPWPR